MPFLSPFGKEGHLAAACLESVADGGDESRTVGEIAETVDEDLRAFGHFPALHGVLDLERLAFREQTAEALLLEFEQGGDLVAGPVDGSDDVDRAAHALEGFQHILDSVRVDQAARNGAVGLAYTREDEAEEVVYLGGRGHCRARASFFLLKASKSLFFKSSSFICSTYSEYNSKKLFTPE